MAGLSLTVLIFFLLFFCISTSGKEVRGSMPAASTIVRLRKVVFSSTLVHGLRNHIPASTYSTNLSPTDETLTLLTRLSNIHRNLKFALDGVKHVSPSANLAYLERDPTQRGPRAQFQVEAALNIRNNLNAAIRDATRFISARKRGNSQSAQVLVQVQSLELLLQPAEEAMLELHEQIREAQDKLDKLSRGIQE